ncbi:MAG: oxidoreductase, partial [Sphingobacteriaceae bacterium]
IEAFSAKEAIMMSSGTPALILKTTDAGESWKVVYRNDDKAYFLDAMDFAGAKTGYVLGDPIGPNFLLLQTADHGNNWKVMPNLPPAIPGEAAFAASGTCLRIIKKRGNPVIVTGGSTARILLGVKSKELIKKWLVENLPITQGEASKGAFSVANSGNHMIIVGGDYQQNKKTDSTNCNYDAISKSNHYKIAGNIPSGFQSCIEYLDKDKFLSTGTSGTNISADGGETWKQIDAISFNVCRKAKHGKLVLLAGDKGKIAKFIND